MGMYVHIGPFSFGGRARHTGPTTKQAWRQMVDSFGVYTRRGRPESKKIKRLRRETRRATTAAVQQHHRDGTIT
ncbi:hypothetical protein SEA_MARKY_41 [Streptomyces phage Marky]|nr:hypothetical protein SEA_MARKY_41 [Streptomyces phage Marky]